MPGLPPLLFNIEHDPGETTNLAGQQAEAATLLQMQQRLLDRRMAHADRSLSAYILDERAGPVATATPLFPPPGTSPSGQA